MFVQLIYKLSKFTSLYICFSLHAVHLLHPIWCLGNENALGSTSWCCESCRSTTIKRCGIQTIRTRSRIVPVRSVLVLHRLIVEPPCKMLLHIFLVAKTFLSFAHLFCCLDCFALYPLRSKTTAGSRKSRCPHVYLMQKA